MIKPTLHPTVIFRVPRFSYQETMEHNWESLKECIKFSSPEFYQIIASLTFNELLSSDPKIQITARKYYNRATFRSTPYALFSGVGAVTMNWNKSTDAILKSGFKVHAFPDWSVKPILNLSLKKLIADNVLFFSNSTFYVVGKEIRFIQKIENDFQIAAVDYDETVLRILKNCSTPRTFRTLKDLLDFQDQLLKEYLEDLLQLQLILTSKHPNIIGRDYFSRNESVFKKDNKQYLISETKVVSGQLDQKLFRHLPDLVLNMQRIMEVPDNKELEEFKSRFTRKFELAEIPLMTVLDPEVGVGYGDMESRVDANQITELLPQKDAKSKSATNSDLKDVLYRLILEKTLSGQPIQLDELINQQSTKAVLANSIHAICTVIDDQLIIESLGGVTANALLGRFANAIDPVYKHCKEIAALEQQCNLDVLLFDVGYTKEDRVDNINRRPSIYDYQFNILNYDTSATPLCASDILISVQQGEIMLRSKSLDKRILPRYASAYNYKRSDLPLFRLLMDIQTQGVLSNLLFRSSNYIPGLAFYPRVQFQNIIVSPARWLLQRDLLKDLKSLEAKCEVLTEHLKECIPCSYIKAGKDDQTLLLNTTKKKDIEILVSLLEQVDKLYLEEAHLPTKPTFYNAHIRPVLPQLIITLTHNNEILQALPSSAKQSYKLDKKEWVSPGREWLYFEIYGSPFRADELLHFKISKFLQANKALIKKWFFIRYNENGDHIRLRLQLKDASNGYELTRGLSALLAEDMESGTVSDLKICTYKKEVHRYSSTLMEQVESYFHRDSEFVLNMLIAMLPDFAKYRLCLDILAHVYDSQIIPCKDFDRTVKMVAENLKLEHELNKEGLKKINVMFKQFTQQTVLTINRRALSFHFNLKKSMANVLMNCPVDSRAKLLVDLMHMHINRLFVSEQRLHELAIYEFYFIEKKRRDYRGELQLREINN